MLIALAGTVVCLPGALVSFLVEKSRNR